MRFKSKKTDGYTVYAVTGVNTVSFAIDFKDANTKGLLGFGVERHDPKEKQRYPMRGFKVFRSVIPHPDEKTEVSTFDHPIQSFVWDDFTAHDNRRYEYSFFPIKGDPKNLAISKKPIVIKVRTEPLYSNKEHDVFFNRGVASSQAYVRRFENKRPDQLSPAKQKEALDWLSRDLDDAMMRFIDQTRAGDTLLCCFYEFRYKPVADRLKSAMGRRVTVRLIFDGKDNGRTVNGQPQPSFPREENLQMLKTVKLKLGKNLKVREARKSNIQHNKFMVLIRGNRPEEVWTGSTNLSNGGIHGQTNVGHWVRNRSVASKFRDYWELLWTDPGGKTGDSSSAVRSKNSQFRNSVEAIEATPQNMNAIPSGVTPLFSPRSDLGMLNLFAEMADNADSVVCLTLAFGINSVFKNLLKDNTSLSHVSFLLLEKKDKPNPRSTQPFIWIDARNNVYKAWGSYLRQPVHQWAKEASAGTLGLNKHVSFIHSKFLLRDPLGQDPIVVTGSANFSNASTQDNDENMLIIRGDLRAADIYFTEFNRLFNHYYFRSVMESLRRDEDAAARSQDSLFLKESDEWLSKYKDGTLRSKRVKIFASMKGF